MTGGQVLTVFAQRSGERAAPNYSCSLQLLADKAECALVALLP